MKFKYIVLLTASSLATLSCGKKFLDRQPIATTVDGTYYQNDAQLITGVNAAYDPLNWYQADAKASSTPVFEFIWGDICSDDALGGGDNTNDIRYSQLGNFEATATTNQLGAVWRNQYVGIRRANVIIEKAPNAPLATEAIKKRVVGEAKFLRAYYHFYLYRMFGPVPYIDHQLQEDEFEQAKPSKDEFFTKLIQDLKDAKDALPYKYSGKDLGRVTKGAASGYLARVLMFKGNSWAEVLSETKSIIADSASNGYNLKTPYNAVHSISTEYGSESLFEIGATSAGPTVANRENEGTYFNKITGPRDQKDDLSGYGLISPSLDLINFFKADSLIWGKMDPRRKATFVLYGDSLNGKKVERPAGGNDNALGYKTKYYENLTLAEQTQGASNIRLLRTADIYLMAAEAAIRIGGTDNDVLALKYTNAVRKRAGMPLYTTITLDNILKERRLEFALESLRFFDIVRQGNAGTIFSKIADTEGKGFVSGKNEVFPIPQKEIDLSGGKITQNSGY